MKTKEFEKLVNNLTGWRDARPFIKRMKKIEWNEDQKRSLNDFLNHQKKNAVSEYEIDLIEDIQLEIISLKPPLRLVHNGNFDQEMTPSDCVSVSYDIASGHGCLWSEVERELIRSILKDYKHNKTKAAKALGVSVRTLRNKINLYKELGFYE